MSNIRQAFREIGGYDPDPALQARVLARVASAEAAYLGRMRIVSAFALSASLAGLVSGLTYFWNMLWQSDFFALLSLLFSDLQIVTSSFQDFLSSLLETLPVIPLSALLVPLAAALWSASLLVALSGRKVSGALYRTASVH